MRGRLNNDLTKAFFRGKPAIHRKIFSFSTPEREQFATFPSNLRFFFPPRKRILPVDERGANGERFLLSSFWFLLDRTSRRLARFGLFHHQGVRCQAHGTLGRGGGERRRRPWRLSQREHPSEGGTHCSSGMRAVGRYPAAHAHSALSPSDPWWVP